MVDLFLLSSKASNFGHLHGILPDVISRRIVIADNENLSLAVFAHSNSELRRVFPHNLREVSCSSCLRLHSKRVVFDFIVPRVYSIFAVNIMVWVGTKYCVISNA